MRLFHAIVALPEVWRDLRRSLLIAFTCICVSFLTAHETAARPNRDLSEFLWPEPNEDLRYRDNKIFSEDDLTDSVVVVSFVVPTCSILCVIRLSDLDDIVSTVPPDVRKHLSILAVSLGSDGDQADGMASIVKAVGTHAAHLTFLSASSRAGLAMMKAIRFVPPPRAADPVPSTIFVFDRRGAMAMRYGGNPVDKRRLTTDLSTLAELVGGVGFDNHEFSSPHSGSGD